MQSRLWRELEQRAAGSFLQLSRWEMALEPQGPQSELWDSRLEAELRRKGAWRGWAGFQCREWPPAAWALRG